MSEIIRCPELEDEKYPYVIKYNCTCGKKIILKAEKKVEKLSKCFECYGKNIDREI